MRFGGGGCERVIDGGDGCEERGVLTVGGVVGGTTFRSGAGTSGKEAKTSS